MTSSEADVRSHAVISEVDPGPHTVFYSWTRRFILCPAHRRRMLGYAKIRGAYVDVPPDQIALPAPTGRALTRSSLLLSLTVRQDGMFDAGTNL